MPRFSVLLLVQSLIMAIAVAGCHQKVDLAAVRTYAEAATLARPSLDKLAQDRYGTCFRKTEYARTSAFGQIPFSDPTVFPEPSSVATSPSNSITQECEDAAFQSAQWLIRNNIVIDYVRALGAIAGVDAKPEHLDELTGKLADGGAIGSTQTKPFANLAKTIAEQLVATNQRASIAIFAQQAQPDLVEAVTSLKAIAQNYSTLLRVERLSLNLLYRTSISGENPARQRLLILRQREDWDTRLRALESKQRAVRAYGNALDDVAKTNTDIVNAASGASLKELVQAATQYAEAFSRDVSDVISALRN